MNPRKSAEVRRVEGNRGNGTINEFEPRCSGSPIKPNWLGPDERKVWKRYAKIGYWLRDADSMALALFCTLAAEVARVGIEKFISPRLSQLILLVGDLGFTPTRRSRIAFFSILRPPP